MGRKADAHTRGPVTSTGVAWATTECDPAPPDAANGLSQGAAAAGPRPLSPRRGEADAPRQQRRRALASVGTGAGRWSRPWRPCHAGTGAQHWTEDAPGPSGRRTAPGPSLPRSVCCRAPWGQSRKPAGARKEGRLAANAARLRACSWDGGQAPAAGRPKDSGRGASEGAETPPRAPRGPSARRVPRRGALHLQSSTERRRRRNKHTQPLRRGGGAGGAGSADSGPCRPAGRTGGERHRRSCGQCPPAGGRRARPASRRGPRGASPALGASLLPRKAPRSLSWAFYSGRFGFYCLRKTPGGLPARGARGGCRPETLGGLPARGAQGAAGLRLLGGCWPETPSAASLAREVGPGESAGFSAHPCARHEAGKR